MNKKLFNLIIFAGLFLATVYSCDKTDDLTNDKLKDIDGNVYSTVKIGNQVWMVENLNTSRYRNGDPIFNVTDSAEWANLTKGAYCDYENDPANSMVSGKLYNWYAVDDKRNIAPLGWHVPSEADWAILEKFLGGNDIAATKLKETGTSHWSNPNTDATNETGFTAMPGGHRYCEGQFMYPDRGMWWSSTKVELGYAWARYMYNDDSYTNRDDANMGGGLSVRCVKN